MVGRASTGERRRLIYGEQARQLDLETYLHLIAVLGLGAATLWGAIPIGLAMGLEPWVAGFAAAMGAALGTLAVKHRITNAVAEGLNSKIQQIKSVARGFRKFANFRIAILFFCGKLDMYPQKSR